MFTTLPVEKYKKFAGPVKRNKTWYQYKKECAHVKKGVMSLDKVENIFRKAEESQ
jgi:hypothetical protein